MGVGVSIGSMGIRQYMLGIRLGWLCKSLSYCWGIGVWIRQLGIFLENGIMFMVKSMRGREDE